MKSKVYFIKDITPKSLVKIYEALGINLDGNVAVKVHSGEAGNQNYLKPTLLIDLIKKVNGTVVECNTAYDGERNTTLKHLKLIHEHEWDKYYNFDLLDATNEIVLENPQGLIIKKNYVGANIKKYDSMLVVSHFKGHPMGGYGGALKQLSIGLASSHGKAYIHGAGDPLNMLESNHDDFLRSMADASKTITNYFKENICYINILANMSVDCDCCSVAEDPCLKDIGILASLDPVAIDEASLDLVKNSNDPGVDHFMERVNSRNGHLTIEAAESLGVGSTDYELINIGEE